jgi:SPASM domain peptide maturase of grasp-with-spasm system
MILQNVHLYFVQLAHCVFVKGARRTVLCDLQRQQLWFVPADMQPLLEASRYQTLEEIYAAAGAENKETLDEYFSFLLEKEAIFLTPHREDINRFLPLPLKNEHFGLVQNAIIDIAIWNGAVYLACISELEQVGCQYIQFRFFTATSWEVIQEIAAFVKDTELRSVDFLLPWSQAFANINLESFLISNQHIGHILFYNAPENDTQSFLNGLSTVQYSTQAAFDQRSCGVIHPKLFVKNQAHFSESQYHNTCLHRKISIDADGNIKNCPSMSESFGNICDTTLAEALEKPGFKKYWNITKDQVAVCKDCEFRHVCTDCRAYLEDPADSYSKPLKCGYNPYTCVWENWSTNPLKKKAADHYHLPNPADTLSPSRRFWQYKDL